MLVVVPFILIFLIIMIIALIDGIHYLLTQVHLANSYFVFVAEVFNLIVNPVLFFFIYGNNGLGNFDFTVISMDNNQYLYLVYLLLGVIVVAYFSSYFKIIYEIPELQQMTSFLLILGIVINFMIAISLFSTMGVLVIFNALIVLLFTNKLIEIHLKTIDRSYEQNI
jgi:hypothetical protein